MIDQSIANNLKMLRDELKALPPSPQRQAAQGHIEEAYALLAPYRPIDLPELQAERDILMAELLKNPDPVKAARVGALQEQIAPLEAIKAQGRKH